MNYEALQKELDYLKDTKKCIENDIQTLTKNFNENVELHESRIRMKRELIEGTDSLIELIEKELSLKLKDNQPVQLPPYVVDLNPNDRNFWK